MSELIFIVDDDERVYSNPQVFLEDEGNQFILQASQQQSQLQFLIHTGSTDYELPDFLRQNSRVRQPIFYKPLFSMEVLVREMCTECIKKIIKLVKMSVFEYIDIPFRLFRRVPCAQKIDT
jgi:hypothetical protein